MDDYRKFELLGSKLVPRNYLQLALNARKSGQISIRVLLEKRKLPEIGWSDAQIEEFIRHLASLDSNNFPSKYGLGEREARIACTLVARRHYNFGHGVGRSGDLLEPQPKAAGSTLMCNLVNALLLDLIQTLGIRSTNFCFLLPMSTGMTLNLCLLTLKKNNPIAKYVLWSRIDQKSCFKCIIASGLTPIIVDTLETENGLETDIAKFKEKIKEQGREQILCLFSTTSCFAPRNCDNIIELAKISKLNNIPHLINNAYGLQSTFLTHQIEQAHRNGRVDMFVQSTDKNLLVPVGGAVVAGFNEALVRSVGKTYAGRASSSQCLDVLMTVLSLGKNGILKLVTERKKNFNYLKDKLLQFSKIHNEELYQLKRNPISIAMTLRTFCDVDNITEFGSLLYTRGVSGVRVIPNAEDRIVDDYNFKGWGRHNKNSSTSYITFAASLGITQNEIDGFLKKLEECWQKFTLNMRHP